MLIQSSRLTLRATESGDIPFVLESERDADNSLYIGQWTLEQHRETLSDQDKLHLIVMNRQGNRVGYMIVSGRLDSNKALCIVRITINPKGQGYGKEAIACLIKWVFDHTDTHRIWLDVKENNVRARHVYESVGFVYEGTLRDSFFNGTEFESLAVMCAIISSIRN